MLVTIAKNNMQKVVSFTAFRNFFKDSGWEIVGEEKSPTSHIKEEVKEEVIEPVEEENTSDEVVEDTEASDDEIPDEEWDEAIAEEDVEKPLSEMNHDELVAKAESLGLTASGKNNSQLRKMIKEVM